MPLYKDPARIKTINGKYILATNDPLNPIRIVRQLNPGKCPDVEIHLANGSSYQDQIHTPAQLVALTSNRLFEVTVQFRAVVILSRHSQETQSDSAEAALCKLMSNLCIACGDATGVDYLPIDDGLFRRRVSGTNVIVRLVIPTTQSKQHKRLRYPTTITYRRYILSPTEVAECIVTDMANAMEEELQRRCREDDLDEHGISVELCYEDEPIATTTDVPINLDLLTQPSSHQLIAVNRCNGSTNSHSNPGDLAREIVTDVKIHSLGADDE